MNNKKYSCDCNIIHEEVVNSTKNKMPSNDLLNELSDFFKILGVDSRMKILFVLDSNEMCVCDIANVLSMTKSSVSHQLNILRTNNIVKCRKEGKEVYYTLDDEHIREIFEVALSHILHKTEERI